MLLLLLLLIFYIFYLCHQTNSYHRSAYYEVTKQSFRSVWMDAGRKGEYLVFQVLRHYEEQGARFLFNCYLPKEDGTTTEIDVLMIHGTGLYVFESKNYSGWIFGHEQAKTWTQTLPQGRGRAHKEHFYNPILQNKGHIKWLKRYLGNEKLPMHSVIVFSDRCTLKKIELTSSQALVINRYSLEASVDQIMKTSPCCLAEYEVDRIYEILYPLTQVSEEEKQQHIRDIQQYK